MYSCLADPHGIAFALDLGEPEQKDIARELVRAAVKETLRARQDARARGGGGAAVRIWGHGWRGRRGGRDGWGWVCV